MYYRYRIAKKARQWVVLDQQKQEADRLCKTRAEARQLARELNIRPTGAEQGASTRAGVH